MSRIRVKIAAIAAVVIMIGASGMYILRDFNHGSNSMLPAISLGPKFTISYSGAMDNNTTIQVQIFSMVPSKALSSSNIIGMNESNNSYYDMLMNVTLVNGTTSTFLSPVFNAIASGWKSLFSRDSGTSMASLAIEATKTVVSGNTTSIYDYYNNLPYNPRSISTITANGSGINATSYSGWFNNTGISAHSYSTISFTKFSFIQRISFPHEPDSVISTPIHTASTQEIFVPWAASSYTDYYYTYPVYTVDQQVYTNSSLGVLPLIAIHMGRNTANGTSEISLGATITILNDTLGMNSAQVGISSTGEVSSEMSTSPSFEHVANVLTGTSGNSYSVYPLNLFSNSANLSLRQNETTAYVGIENVTYTFTHFNQYTNSYRDYWEVYYWIYAYNIDGQPVYKTNGPSLVNQTLTSSVYDGNFTIGEISDIRSVNGIRVSAGFLPVQVNAVFQYLLEGSSNGTIALNSSGSGSTLEASTAWAHTYGYTDGSQAIQNEAGALGDFSTAIDTGLVIIDALAATDVIGWDIPAIVAYTAGLISMTLGLTARMLSSFSTISFVSGTNAASIAYWVTNAPAPIGTGYDMQLFESSTPLSFTANGNSYSIYAPTDYINATSTIA